MIGIVPGSEVSTPSAVVKMDSGALREAALAPGQLAQAIGQDVGGLFQDISQKIQANRNAKTVFQADLAMRKTKDDFTAQLHQMPDENTWLPSYKEQVNALREGVMSGPNVGPDVKRVLEQKFDTWEAATTSQIRTAALLKGAKDTKEAAIADSTYAAHQGDVEGAKAILDAAVAHFAMTSADAKKFGSRFPTMAAQAKADTAISTNPIQAPDLIKQFEGVMEPRMYVAIQAKAREAKNAAQSGNVNDLSEQMDQSPDGAIDPKLISAKVKSGEITQRAADALNARMAKTKATTAKDNFNVAMLAVDDHDFTDDKTPAENARKLKDEGASLPEALRRRLYDHIDSRVEQAQKKGEKEERPVEKQVMEDMRDAREKQGAFVPLIPVDVPSKSHWFSANEPATKKSAHIDGGLAVLHKMTDDDVKTSFPGFTKDQLIEAERKHAGEMAQKMREWFKDPANKNATFDEANEYRMKLQKPYVMGAVEQAIIGAPVRNQAIDDLVKKYAK